MDSKLRPLNLKSNLNVVENKTVKNTVTQTKKRWKKLKTTSKFFFLGLIILVGGLLFFSSSVSSPVSQILGNTNPVDLDNGRLNVALLGISGPGHDGPNLTDTIMVASYDTKTHEVNLISLPRDLWVDKYKAKVNTLYQKGLDNGNGLEYAEQGLSEILGIKIPYGIRVTFSGFVKAVDLVGGIDVDVQRKFDDYAYPIEGKEADLCGNKDTEQDIPEDKAKELSISPGKHRVLLTSDDKIATASADNQKEIVYDPDSVLKFFPCRFEHVHFDQGLNHMDGETALKYVRSRHALGVEGSDFSRSKRQQLVLQAFKDKVLSAGTLTDPSKIVGLLQTFGNTVEYDLPTSKFVTLIEYAKSVKSVKSHVIDFGGELPLLIHPQTGDYGGAWVLTPTDKDYTLIHGYIQDVLNHTDTGTASAQQKPNKLK